MGLILFGILLGAVGVIALTRLVEYLIGEHW